MNADSPRPPDCPVLWPPDLAQLPPPPPWLWAGYLAPGHITILTSHAKAGKTTLVAALLARLGNGGSLAGQEVRPGKAVVVSEEGPHQWQERILTHDFGHHVCFLCRPFVARPTPVQWQALIDQMLALHSAHQFALVVIDPLAEFLPLKSENEANLVLDAMLTLRQLTAAGLAVLLLHHRTKSRVAAGQQARGSTALTAHADILIELSPCSSSTTDRRRNLRATSRSEATPRRLLIERNEAGTDYICLAQPTHEDSDDAWQCLKALLADQHLKRTQSQLLENWPTERHPLPNPATLWRWLNRAANQGQILRDGKGHKDAPYRYWLPDLEERKKAKEEEYWQTMTNLFGPEWVEAQQKTGKKMFDVEDPPSGWHQDPTTKETTG